MKIDWKKILAVVGGLVILAGVGYLLVLFDLTDKGGNMIEDKPSTAEVSVADWKTYRNEKYGYEIKYPKEWSVYSDLALESFPSFDYRYEVSNPKNDKYLFLVYRPELAVCSGVGGCAYPGEIFVNVLSPSSFTVDSYLDFLRSNTAFSLGSKVKSNSYPINMLVVATDVRVEDKSSSAMYREFIPDRAFLRDGGSVALLEMRFFEEFRDYAESVFDGMVSSLRVFKPTKSEADLEIEKLLDDARPYVNAHSVKGMGFDLEFNYKNEKCALLTAIPVTVVTDRATVVMIKRGAKWEGSTIGTAVRFDENTENCLSEIE